MSIHFCCQPIQPIFWSIVRLDGPGLKMLTAPRGLRQGYRCLLQEGAFVPQEVNQGPGGQRKQQFIMGHMKTDFVWKVGLQGWEGT